MSLIVYQNFVDGAYMANDSGETFDVINPARGDVIISLPDMGVDDAKYAIEQAAIAQKEWATWTGKERAAVIGKMHKIMTENAEDLG